MNFSGQNLPLPRRPFPFDPSAQVLPTCVPDCHLVRTVIPCLPSYDSLGDFHGRTNQVLASFASMVSRGNIGSCYGHNNYPRAPLSPHVHSRQATLHIAHDSVHHFAGSYLIRTRRGFQRSSTTSSHKLQVSTETGSYAPCHWSAPGNLNPQHPP